MSDAVIDSLRYEIKSLRERLEQAERERDNYNEMYEQALITATQSRKYGFRAGIEAAANRDRIERLMKSYRLTETIDADGIGFPLIDALSCDYPTVLEGEKEIFMLADHICGDILALSPTDNATTVAGVRTWREQRDPNPEFSEWSRNCRLREAQTGGEQ